jgi:TldD protein
MSKKHPMSRRSFIGQGATGLTTVAFSPALLEMLLSATGCKAGPGGAAASGHILAEDVLAKAVSLLMAKGADFGDAYVERAAFDSVMSDDRKINTTTTIEKGVGFRAVKEGRTFYAYTDSFEPERVYETARYVADAAAAPAASTAPAVITLKLKPLTSPLAFPIKPLPSEIGVDKTVELFKGLTERAWSADPRVVQAMQFLREIIRQVQIATSDGRIIGQTLGLTEFMAQTFVKGADGQLQVAFDGRGAYAGRDFFAGEHAFEKVVDSAAAKAVKLLEAVDSPRGVFPVVLGPGMNGVLFHESCGHGMEADLVFKGSNYKDQIGKQTAAKGVTLIDDGTVPAFPGSYAFDDEGTPAQRTVLIEDGIQRSYLCDKIWGAKLGMPSTGSGRRQSFRYPPIPRMRNTFIDKGPVPAADIIAATRRGIYITDVGGGGQVDVITGNFMMGVGEAYLIEGGKITRPIKGATISGMGIEAMKSIDMVGDDLKLNPSAGRCGKMQSAPVGEGMPTIRVRNILVGGKGEAWTDIEGGKGGSK